MKGFTLVETLVAITILTLAVLAPFGAIQNVVSASRLSQERLIASGLAQEGMEYVRFIRMNNYLANPTPTYPTTILNGMNGVGGPDCTGAGINAKWCTIDATAVFPAFSACAGACPALYLNTLGGFYTQSSIGATQTIYTRSVNVVHNANYDSVTVIVTWNDRGAQTMTLFENQYDWL